MRSSGVRLSTFPALPSRVLNMADSLKRDVIIRCPQLAWAWRWDSSSACWFSLPPSQQIDIHNSIYILWNIAEALHSPRSTGGAFVLKHTQLKQKKGDKMYIFILISHIMLCAFLSFTHPPLSHHTIQQSPPSLLSYWAVRLKAVSEEGCETVFVSA